MFCLLYNVCFIVSSVDLLSKSVAVVRNTLSAFLSGLYLDEGFFTTSCTVVVAV